MRKDIKVKNGETSQIDKYIKIIKEVSFIGSLVTGLGLLMLYFLGIAMFSSMGSAFGVYPFEFSLRKCLEYGSVFFCELLVIFPVLLWMGIQDYFNEAGFVLHLLFFLPLLLVFAIKYISSRSQLTARRFLPWVIVITLLYSFIFLLIVYIAEISAMAVQNILLDPAVNVAIQHKAELENGAQLSKFGITHMDTWTLNTIIKDQNWKMRKIGTMFLIALISVLYVSIIIVVTGKTISKTDIMSLRVHGYVVFMRRSLICIFVIFMVGILFVIPGRTCVLIASTTAPKVEVSLRDRKNITSQYYAVLFAEYDNDYMLYFPSQQNLIRVPKNKVESILFKGSVSMFAERYYFKKGPWLGISGEWTFTKDKGSQDKKISGFKVNTVHVNSPAYKADILPEDIITSIDGIPLNGSRQLSEIVECIPLGKSVQLFVRRSNTVITSTVMIENKP